MADGKTAEEELMIFCERFYSEQRFEEIRAGGQGFLAVVVAAFGTFSTDRSRAGGCGFVQERFRDPDRWSRISSSARQQAAAFGVLPLFEAGQVAAALFGNDLVLSKATAGG
ncbi:hypothetical protein AXF42_Ash002283 [Apostasia shenzhenica]|uniref:Uncharacterized protein n=1 Tax=Apostasia shenzhenica TaxID=1088818 RepID=A0A2I0AN45_9ASPA|nr:hypothetical protein AXF42_Ash002283 [Apostasia shenzhenica]